MVSSIKALGLAPLFASLAFAQSFTNSSTTAALSTGVSTVYDTVVYTITSCAPTVTNCPLGKVTTSLVPAAPYTTVYVTAYVDVCPTGIVTSTYTITQTCSLAKCHPTAAIPSGFVVTTKVCDACAGQPTVTVTCPSTPTLAPLPPPYANGTVSGAPGPVGPTGCGTAGCIPAMTTVTGCAGCAATATATAKTDTVSAATTASACSGTACTTAVVVTAGANNMVSPSNVAAVLLGMVGLLAMGL